MLKRTLIVGNQFEDFCTKESTITLSQFEKRFENNELEGHEFIIGQGIKHDEVERLGQLNNIGNFTITPRNQLAPMALTHKHESKNIMISEPIKEQDRLYGMELMLNDESDRLIDHITGSHISGMVLVEAARQASIACSEIELDIEKQTKKQGFIWKGMNVNFKRFVFPTLTDIKVNIVIHEDSTDEKTVMSTVVSFLQNDKEVCAITNDFDVVARSLINSIESHSADKLIRETTTTISEMANKKCAA